MKHIYAFALLVFTLQSVNAQNFQWIKKAGGNSFKDSGRSIAIDSSGNVYCAGLFADTAWFESTLLVEQSGYASFISKYDPTGAFLWAKAITASNQATMGDIAADKNGNIYITGKFGGTASFGSTIKTAVGNDDFFLAKYNTNGVLTWVKTVGASSSTVRGTAISDVIGDKIYVGGQFSNTILFDSSDSVSSLGGNDIFIAKYDTSAELSWVKSVGTTRSQDYIAGISIDKKNNESVYITGNIGHTSATFGSTAVNASDDGYIFTARADSAGNFIWVETAGGSNYQYSRNIFVNDSGNVYITGEFNGNCSFGSSNFVSNGADDLFISKYDSSGTYKWTIHKGGSDYETGRGLFVDQNGDIYVTGHFKDTVNFGGTSSSISNGASDAFIAKYDNSQTLQWILQGGGSLNDIAYDIAYKGVDDLFIIGNFTGTAVFGSHSVSTVNPTANASDIYVTRIQIGTTSITSTNSVDSKVSIYPNPAKDILHIQNQSDLPIETILLCDIEGRVVFNNTTPQQSSFKIDVSNISHGVYVLTVVRQNEIVTKKVVLH